MNRYQVVWSGAAKNSILEIVKYIEVRGYPGNAKKFYFEIEKFGESLGNFPNKYAICRQIHLAKRKMRCVPFKRNYMFIYKKVDSQLKIYNVVHVKTNPESWRASPF